MSLPSQSSEQKSEPIRKVLMNTQFPLVLGTRKVMKPGDDEVKRDRE